MSLKTGFATLGAVPIVAVVAAIYFALGASWTVLGIVAAVVCGVGLVSYIVASITATSSFGEFMRGWLIGLNAVLNVAVGYAIVSQFAGVAGGAIVGAILGAINLLCVFAPVSQNSFFQGLIGYMNWLLPMSWLIVALGLMFYLISFLLHAVTVGKVNFLKIQGMDADWKTGTFFIKGGLIANLNYAKTAFNMGNFSFVYYQSKGGWHIEHEAGHTLNLAAFGWLFHLIGAIDENVIPNRGHNAYSERLAESNDGHSTLTNNIPMWA